MDSRGRESTPRSWTARIVAPLVLVVVAGAIVVIISSSMESGSGGGQGGPKTTQTQGCKPAADQAVKDGYYVVQADDTAGLSGIASKTCIPVDRLVKLNPNLDPQLLQAQNCVDLVPDGCKKLAGG